jgi:protein gp37
MSASSKIEWTDATWNPVTGCTEVTPGCDNCYAKTFAERWRGTPGHYFEQGFDVVLRPGKLTLPTTWRKPRRVFVNSMSDLFHDQVPDAFIAEVFAVMARTPRHTYQLLTKRHGRMKSLLNRPSFRDTIADVGAGWPLPNVWLGVSVEDQKRADMRIPALLDTPAWLRWLSCEPLLGSVELAAADQSALCDGGIDWVVVGGESGLRSRPMLPIWARDLRDECTKAGVPFFFKQWGGRTPKANGRELDSRTWDEFPVGPRGMPLVATSP